jgi:hypothetical protein
MTEFREAALAYAEHGWSVVPSRVTGKRALVTWKCWQATAPDPDQLCAWWRRWPRANVAVVTGRVSGVVVLDVDVRHGGDHALAELEQRHGGLPRTTVVETPGGYHFYLAHPGGRIANSASRLGRGLDVRGDGGLALLPPSHRPDGAYRWAAGGPDTLPAIPAAWAEPLRPPTRQAVAGVRTATGAAQPLGGPPRGCSPACRAVEDAPAGSRRLPQHGALLVRLPARRDGRAGRPAQLGRRADPCWRGRRS